MQFTADQQFWIIIANNYSANELDELAEWGAYLKQNTPG